MAPQTLRMRSAPWICLASWTMLTALIAQPLVLGQWDVVVSFGPGIALIAWLLYLFLWAPRIVFDRNKVQIRNVWKTTTIPYRIITDIAVRGLVKITYTSGEAEQVITAWNAPGVPRMQNLSTLFKRTNAAPETPGRKPCSPDAGPSQAVVEAWHQADADGHYQLEHRLHLCSAIITVLLSGYLLISAIS